MYGFTPVQFYPIRSQCSHNLHQLNFLQGSFELGWKRAQHSISTSFAAKQVARFCYLFYPSLKSQSNFKTKRTKKPYLYSPILLILKKKRITSPNFLSFWKAKTCRRINSKNNVYIFLRLSGHSNSSSYYDLLLRMSRMEMNWNLKKWGRFF